jgi:hypothetical protein
MATLPYPFVPANAGTSQLVIPGRVPDLIRGAGPESKRNLQTQRVRLDSGLAAPMRGAPE